MFALQGVTKLVQEETCKWWLQEDLRPVTMGGGFIFFIKQRLNISFVIGTVLDIGDAKVSKTDEGPG